MVDFLTPNDRCWSKLLSLGLNTDKGYIQSQWNMVGNLSHLLWQPTIDVVGRTKFWYQLRSFGGANTTNGVEVLFYNKEWDIPTSKALLQMVTPDQSNMCVLDKRNVQ